MMVGIPGVGIGGLFYILSAIAMPFREVVRVLRRRDPIRWRVVLAQSALAFAIVVAIASAGVGLGWLVGWIDPGFVARVGVGAVGSQASKGIPTVLQATAIFLAFGTLAAVLAMVQVLRLVVRER